jgi:IS30 family transposase
LPEELRRSLTWDQGKKMARHRSFTIATDLQGYFCDPRSPWQRGTNENTNGLLRQYFPRTTNLAFVSQDQLDAVALKLNQRPEKPWTSRPRPIGCKECCSDRFNPPVD